jgi:hypothetical protein
MATEAEETETPETPPEFCHTIDAGGVTITLTTSAGSDGAVVVFIDTEGQPDGSDGWRGLRVMVNDGDVFVGVPYRNSDGDIVEREES